MYNQLIIYDYVWLLKYNWVYSITNSSNYFFFLSDYIYLSFYTNDLFIFFDIIKISLFP